MAEHSVVLTLTADPDHLPWARVVAVSCGALAGLSMDHVDDLRQCTQEALAVLLGLGASAAEAAFTPAAGAVTVRATASVRDVTTPDPESFAWMLIEELADDARATVTDDRLTITFRVGSPTAGTVGAGS